MVRKQIALVAMLLATVGSARAQFPSYKSAGALTASTGTCTPAMPSGILADDLLLAVAESENQAISLSTANGFAEIPNSPQSAGTAATDPANRIAVYYKRAGGGDAAPVFADAGDHTSCRVYLFRSVRRSGNPWDVTAGGNDGGANDTSGVIPGATTTVKNTLVVLIQGTSNNATATTNCGTVTNADLANITERTDNSNTAGLGGGHCLITGEKASVGAYANSTLTLSPTTFKAAISMALAPEPDDSKLVNIGSAADDAAGTSLACSAQNHTAGNLLVVVGLNDTVGGSGQISGIADTAGNAYTAAAGALGQSATVGSAEIWYAKNISGSASNVVTITWTGSVSFRRCAVLQYSGMDTASPLDVGGSGSCTACTSVPSSSFAPNVSGNVNVAGWVKNGAGGYTGPTSPYAERLTFGDGVIADWQGAPSGAQTAAATMPSADGVMVVASFKVAGGSPPPGSYPGWFGNSGWK